MKLKGKVGIVTGAGSGIGSAIARELAREGVQVVLVDINIEAVDKICEGLTQEGLRAIAMECDVANQSAVEEVVRRTVEQFSKIDILVNNAGITSDNLILRLSETDWHRVIAVNLDGAFYFIKSVAKYMVRQRSGKIINISSVIGLIGNEGQANYAASKAGLIGLTKSVAKELSARNIQVNAIAPGFIDTPMTQKLPEDYKKKMLASIPLRRFGSPQDVANVALFLASSDSDYITGQVIIVDGGMVM